MDVGGVDTSELDAAVLEHRANPSPDRLARVLQAQRAQDAVFQAQQVREFQTRTH